MAAWNPRANEIFAAALELPAQPEQQAYIDRACEGDDELRRQVETLLAAHARAGSFLDAPAPAVSDVTQSHAGVAEPPTANQTESAEDIDSRIGPYKLLQKLGEGGMGSVWVAEQSEPVRRRVALKLIKPGMDSARVIARFEAERQALALMDHTNIAKVFDAGTTETGRPYFAMELVKGVPITTYCDELHLSIRERLDLFVPVCRAVQHAHQKGVIHRDIKPTNVLVSIQDGKPVPKVIDFGVAKALHTKLAERTLYTEIGAVIGTLEYMAPEQAELSALDVDTRADVYALGALLYELLTGTTPLTRDRLKSAGFAEVLRIIKEEEPPPPSTRLSRSGEEIGALAAKRRTEPRKLGAEVRGELDWIVMKCLEKDRTRRYETASGLAQDVERYLKDEPVEACPPSAGYRFRKFLRRNRAMVNTAWLVFCAILGGSAFSIWQAWRASEAEFTTRLFALSLRDALDRETEARAAADRARDDAEKRQEETERAWLQAQNERDAKQAALTRSDGLRLGSEAMLARPANPGLSLLLGLEAVRRYPHPLTFNALYDAAADLREQRGITLDIFSLQFLHLSPDGGKFLIGTSEGHGIGPGSAAIHDTTTGRRLAAWQGFGCGLNDLDWSPDGSRVVATIKGQATVMFTDGQKPEQATFTDRVAYVWDAATGRDLVHLRRHDDKVVSCRFSPDGTRVLTGSWDGTARLWDAANGKELHVLRGHTKSLLVALFSPDGRRVLTVGAQEYNTVGYRDESGKPRPDREPNPDPGPTTRPYRLGHSTGGYSSYGGKPEQAVARVWNPDTGESTAMLTLSKGTAGFLEPSQERPLAAAFRPDGRRVAVGFDNGLVALWDADAGGKPARTFGGGHRGAVRALAFSPDGRRLVTAGDGGKVFLWYLETDDLSRVIPLELEGHENKSVQSVRFSKDGERFVTTAADKSARVWDADSGRALAALRGHDWSIADAHFLGDRDTVVTAGDSTVRFWSVRQPTPVATLLTGRKPGPFDWLTRGFGAAPPEAPTGGITALAFSPDGGSVVTGSTDYVARLWDAESGQLKAALKNRLRGIVRNAVFTPDGKSIFIGTDLNWYGDRARGDGKDTLLSMVHRWDLATGTAPRLLREQASGVAEMDVTPDGRRLLVRSSQNALAFQPTESDPLAYGGSGRSDHSSLTVWDAQTGRLLSTPVKSMTPDQPSAPAQFSPDGRTVLFGEPTSSERNNYDLNVYDAETGAFVRRLAPTKDDRYIRWAVALFSPDGRTIAARKYGGRFVSFWAADTGALLGSFPLTEGNPGWEATARFSPDSKRLAVGSERVVHLVDVATRTSVQVLRGHEARVAALVFSPDGSRLLTGSEDHSAAVWDVETGRILAVYKGHPGPVRLVAYSPDGKRVATASTDPLARVWPVDLLPEFERRKPRELTEQERDRYELPRK